MSLTDTQIYELAKRMQIPLAKVLFKDELPKKLEFNKTYIINLQDSVDDDGAENSGTHWTMLQVNKTPNGKIEPIFFDPYGAPPSEHIKACVKNTTGKAGIPHTKKDVQSLMNNACGFFCLAIAHFINASKFRSGSLYDDISVFLDMFDDLNVSVDFKKNEYILKHFFRSENELLRSKIEVVTSIDNITDKDEKGGVDAFKLPVDVKVMDR